MIRAAITLAVTATLAFAFAGLVVGFIIPPTPAAATGLAIPAVDRDAAESSVCPRLGQRSEAERRCPVSGETAPAPPADGRCPYSGEGSPSVGVGGDRVLDV